MAVMESVRYQLAGEVHDFGASGFSARHPLFGAKGDYDPETGTGADDTVALQAWIHHGEALYDALDLGHRHNPATQDYSGVLLVLPAGNYRVSGTLTLNRPLRLQGAGWNESVIHATTNQPVLHYERRGASPMARAVVRHIGFEGTHQKFYSNYGRHDQHGVYVTKDPGTPFNIHIDVVDCQFYALGGAGVHGFFQETADPNASGDKFRIMGCHFAVCGDFGIKLSGRHATAYITRNHIHECAGGIGLLGTAALPVSACVIERNIIEANTTGAAPPGTPGNPAVGIQCSRVFIARIERNYFEWHLNGIYLSDHCSGVQIVRNHFDGNDVNLPQAQFGATGNRITRQLSPVYWDDTTHTDVVVEENDVYVPVKPPQAPMSEWAPGTPPPWGEAYEVFPSVRGHAHQLVRNGARIAGGEVRDATFHAPVEGSVYFESVAPVAPGVPEVRHRAQAALLSHRAAGFEHESSDAAQGVFHDLVYPAALPDPLRVRHALRPRQPDGALGPRQVVSAIGPQGWTLYGAAVEGDLALSGAIAGNGWVYAGPPEHRRTLVEVVATPGDDTVLFQNLAVPPHLSGARTSDDDDAGPLLGTRTLPPADSRAGVRSGDYQVVRPGWLPELTTTLVLVDAANVRVWAGLFSAAPGGSATPAVRLAGFRYDTGVDGTAFWRCVTSDGTGHTVAGTATPVVAGRRYNLRVRFVDAGTVEFYVDGARVAVLTSTLPGAGPLGFENSVTALGGTPVAIRTGRIALTHDA